MTSIPDYILLEKANNFMRKIWFFWGALIISSCIKSDSDIGPVSSDGSVAFVKTFGGSKNDVAKSAYATSDGGFVVLAYTQSTDGDVTGKEGDSFDYWILKFDSEADLQWSKTYGGTGDDRGSDIIQTSDGGFALLGYTDSVDGDVTASQGLRDFWIVKTDAFGNISWQKSFGFSGIDQGTKILETSDNHLLLSGILDVTASGGQGNFGRFSTRHAGGDYWSIKISSNGDIVWSKFYGGSFTDNPQGVIENSRNEFIIVGGSDSNDVDITNNKGSYDFWVVKSDHEGEIIWEKSYGGSEIDEARGIISSEEGSYVIVGDTRSNDQDISLNNGAADLWIIKITEDGDILWNHSYGGSSFDVPRSIAKTLDNGYIISGSSRSSDGDVSKNNGQNDAWIVKTTNDGQLVWEKSIGGSEIDFCYDSVQLNDGSLIAVGETYSSDGDILENKGFADVLIIKMN
ncbi:MAG: Uncharacterised protein [Flavobacterium sp. SCGC AAA160-P02]|nr:MAG: Uncharacterised protein [Flavobacterium sp. SCGC AAA160-P02]